MRYINNPNSRHLQRLSRPYDEWGTGAPVGTHLPAHAHSKSLASQPVPQRGSRVKGEDEAHVDRCSCQTGLSTVHVYAHTYFKL